MVSLVECKPSTRRILLNPDFQKWKILISVLLREFAYFLRGFAHFLRVVPSWKKNNPWENDGICLMTWLSSFTHQRSTRFLEYAPAPPGFWIPTVGRQAESIYSRQICIYPKVAQKTKHRSRRQFVDVQLFALFAPFEPNLNFCV